MNSDLWTDSKRANVALYIMRQLIVVLAWAACLGLAVAVLSSCTRRQAYPLQCQFAKQAGLYTVDPRELEKTGTFVFVERDGRRFALHRAAIIACEEVRP